MEPLVTPLQLSVGFSAIAAVVAAVLLVFALRAYARSRDPAFGFLAAAFTVFGIKSALVAYSLVTGFIGHEYLELVDAVGDLSTILLITFPILFAAR